jgi:NAD(P)H dehydrogenase (quinone)
MTTKIAVIYYSQNGHTKALAEGVAAGAEEWKDTEVTLISADQATTDLLERSDGIIWGSAGRFGQMANELKSFVDKTGGLYARGTLANKVGAAFCTIASDHGGMEMTLMSMLFPFFHHGMIVVGLPAGAADNGQYGLYYGAGATCPVETTRESPPNLPGPSDMKRAQDLGRRVAQVAEATRGMRAK